MKAAVYNIKGEQVKDMELPQEIFEVELNAEQIGAGVGLYRTEIP